MQSLQEFNQKNYFNGQIDKALKANETKIIDLFLDPCCKFYQGDKNNGGTDKNPWELTIEQKKAVVCALLGNIHLLSLEITEIGICNKAEGVQFTICDHDNGELLKSGYVPPNKQYLNSQSMHSIFPVLDRQLNKKINFIAAIEKQFKDLDAKFIGLDWDGAFGFKINNPEEFNKIAKYLADMGIKNKQGNPKQCDPSAATWWTESQIQQLIDLQPELCSGFELLEIKNTYESNI
jgi:hypothetical protein